MNEGKFETNLLLYGMIRLECIMHSADSVELEDIKKEIRLIVESERLETDRMLSFYLFWLLDTIYRSKVGRVKNRLTTIFWQIAENPEQRKALKKLLEGLDLI